MRFNRFQTVYSAFTALHLLALISLLAVTVVSAFLIVGLLRQPALEYTEVDAEDCDALFSWSRSVRSQALLNYDFRGPQDTPDRRLANGAVMRLLPGARISFYLGEGEDPVSTLLEFSLVLSMLFPSLALWYFLFQMQQILQGVLRKRVFFSPAYVRRMGRAMAVLAAGPAIDYALMQLLKPAYARVLGIPAAQLGYDIGYSLIIYLPILLALATMAVFMHYGDRLRQQQELTV